MSVISRSPSNIPASIHELKYVFKAEAEAQQQADHSSLDEKERKEAEELRYGKYFYESKTAFPTFTMKYSSVPSYLNMAKFYQFAGGSKLLKWAKEEDGHGELSGPVWNSNLYNSGN